MTEPAPLTPPECDLRGMPYMPVDIVRLFDSDMYALSTGDEFKAAFSLWGKAFLQVPAGSLPDDDRILAHLSGAGTRWAKVKEMAMRGWVKCSDGRLYHSTVAEKAREAWEIRLAHRARTEAARAARAASRKVSGSDTPPSVTETVTTSVTENVTTLVAHNVTGSKGREGKGSKEEEKKERPSDERASAALPVALGGFVDARAEVWGGGLALLRGLTGKPEGPSRALLGKLLKSARDDCPAVMRALRDATDLRPVDPVSWLTAALNQPDDDTRLLRAAGLLAAPGREIDGESLELFQGMLQ